MSHQAAASLPTLPVEMLHRILDELDGTTIFLSVRDVCQSLRAAVESHRRYALDFISVSKPNFHRLLRLIRPECVTALSISNDETTPGSIGLFLSLVNIGLFIRLRSLSLLNINDQDMCTFLKHAKKCFLTSLIVHLRSSDSSRVDVDVVAQYIWPIIAQPCLLRLELFPDREVSSLISQFEWSIPCKLRHLRIKCQLSGSVAEMIAGSPELETLELEHQESRDDIPWHFKGQDLLSTSFPRLTSLTLRNFSIFMSQAQLLLSQTPCLRHLRVVTLPDYMINGSQWEDLIKSRLPLLNKFEFYIRFSPD